MSEWFVVMFSESLVFLMIASGVVYLTDSYDRFPPVPVSTCCGMFAAILMLMPALAVQNFDSTLRTARAIACVFLLHYASSIAIDYMYNERAVTLMLFAGSLDDSEWQNSTRLKQLAGILPSLSIASACVYGACSEAIVNEIMPRLGTSSMLLFIMVSNTQLMTQAHMQERISIKYLEQSVENGHITIVAMSLSFDVILTILGFYAHNAFLRTSAVTLHLVLATAGIVVVLATEIFAQSFYPLNFAIACVHALARVVDCLQIAFRREDSEPTAAVSKTSTPRLDDAPQSDNNLAKYSINQQSFPSIDFGHNHHASWNSVEIPGVVHSTLPHGYNDTEQLQVPFNTYAMRKQFVLPGKTQLFHRKTLRPLKKTE